MNASPREAVEVATAGHPVEAVAAATADRWSDHDHVYYVSVAHDDGCPTVSSRRLVDCTCEILELVGRQIA